MTIWLNLNNEIKWLNMMIWLKKPKKYVEDLEKRFEIGEKNIQAEVKTYIKEQFKVKGGSVLANKKLSKEIKTWNEDIKSKFTKIERKLEAIREIPKESMRGNHETKVYKWPLYEELLGKIKIGTSKFMQIDWADLKAAASFDTNEQKAVDKLKKVIGEWNESLKKKIEKMKAILANDMNKVFDGK